MKKTVRFYFGSKAKISFFGKRSSFHSWISNDLEGFDLFVFGFRGLFNIVILDSWGYFSTEKEIKYILENEISGK